MNFEIDRDFDFTDSQEERFKIHNIDVSNLSDKDAMQIVKEARFLTRTYTEPPKLGDCELCGKHTYIHKTDYEDVDM